MVEAGEPRIPRLLERFEGLGRLAAAVRIGMVKDLNEGVGPEGKIAADGPAVVGQVTEAHGGAKTTDVKGGHLVQLAGLEAQVRELLDHEVGAGLRSPS